MNSSKDGEQIAHYLKEYSNKAKTMARTIVIAIIGTCWSMSYDNGTFTPSAEIKTSILYCVIYLFLDVLFYFIMTITCKLILTCRFKPVPGGFAYRKQGDKIKKMTRYIHEGCFVWIIAMLIVLLMAAGNLIDHVWSLSVNCN